MEAENGKGRLFPLLHKKSESKDKSHKYIQGPYLLTF